MGGAFGMLWARLPVREGFRDYETGSAVYLKKGWEGVCRTRIGSPAQARHYCTPTRSLHLL